MLTSKHKRNNLKADMGVQRNRNQKGFTLIEIVLVLAIAGLIFVIVFLAVQGAQRGRRDTERKSAAGRMIATAEQVASNDRGTYPANVAGNCPTKLINAYSAGGYDCTGNSTFADNKISYSGPNFICSADQSSFTTTRIVDGVTTNASSRTIAVGVILETGQAPYCVDNS